MCVQVLFLKKVLHAELQDLEVCTCLSKIMQLKGSFWNFFFLYLAAEILMVDTPENK